MSDPTKVFSDKQEQRIATALGWKRVVASGSRDFHPGDITSDAWLGECKTHTSPDHKLIFDASVWNKIVEEASAKFRYPVLFVDDGSQLLSRTWCAVPIGRPDPTYCCLIDNCPFKYRKNLMMGWEEAQAKYIEACNKASMDVIWRVSLGKHAVGILPFDKFQRLFEEYTT